MILLIVRICSLDVSGIAEDDGSSTDDQIPTLPRQRQGQTPSLFPVRLLCLLLIPASPSATAVYQILNDDNGIGLMFETKDET